MTGIEEIIGTMDTDQKNRFVLQQRQKNKRSDTHNIQLFKILASGKSKKYAASKIYPNKNDKAFNVLKKRLFDNLIDFIANEGFKNDASNEMELLKWLLTARILLKQQLYKPGFKLLKKVSDKAKRLELYALAAESYHTHLEYLHKDSYNQIEYIISETQENQLKLRQAESLNLNFALFRQSISNYRNQKETQNLDELLETFFGSESGLQDSLTYKSLVQLMDIINEYASVHQEYHRVNPFMKKTYELIAKKGNLSHHRRYYKIQALYLMANLYFRNKDFRTSQDWLHTMENLMQAENNKYHKRFLLKLTLLKSLNLHFSGHTTEAISITETNLNSVLKPEISDKNNLLLALGMYYFHISDFKKTGAILRSWHSADATYEKRMGIDWTTKKNLFEIIFHIEMENRELALSRIKSFKRRYSSYLSKLKNAFVFLKLIEMHLKKPENTSSQAFINHAEKSISWQNQNQEDIFVISFYAWLKSKMMRKSLSEVLKDILHTSGND